MDRGVTAGIVAIIAVLAITAYQGLLGMGFNTLMGISVGAGLGLLGAWFLYDRLEGEGETLATALSFLIALGLVLLPLAAFVPAVGQATGLRAAPTEPTPEKPAKEAFVSAKVWDQYSTPLAGVGSASIDVVGSQPVPKEPMTSLLDNGATTTGSSGGAMIKIGGTYPNQDAWVIAYKSGTYYPDTQKVNTAETKTEAVNNQAELNLANIGTLNYKLMNKEDEAGGTSGDNISISGSTITLDADSGNWEFDLVLETSESDSALRNLEVTAENNSSVSTGTLVEVNKVEGDITSSLYAGDPDLIDDDEVTYQFNGDLEYMNDIMIHFTFDNTSNTGTIATVEINDLFDGVAVNNITGISKDTITIQTA